MGVQVKEGLEPVIDAGSRVLILGTLPGDESLRLGQYADLGNQFWGILERVYDEPVGTDYTDKLRFLRRRGLALWDVLHSAERAGSLDRDIRNGIANDFAALFRRYPSLRAIFFNGGKAGEFFRRLVAQVHHVEIGAAREPLILPSSSGTPGRHVLPLEEKVTKWKVVRTL